MVDDGGAATRLAAARCLQRAGRWELGLALIEGDKAGAAVGLRAGMLVDRHLWRLDPTGEAEAAVHAVRDAGDRALAALLEGQLVYWRLLFGSDPEPPDAGRAERALRLAAGDERFAGWGTFWLGVLADNVGDDRAAAAEHYQRAAKRAEVDGDRLLESYTARHQGAHHLRAGRQDEATGLLRHSLHLRASVGAVPHVAAAQASLADALPAGPEREALRQIALATARELGLTWLRRSLEGRLP